MTMLEHVSPQTDISIPLEEKIWALNQLIHHKLHGQFEGQDERLLPLRHMEVGGPCLKSLNIFYNNPEAADLSIIGDGTILDGTCI